MLYLLYFHVERPDAVHADQNAVYRIQTDFCV